MRNLLLKTIKFYNNNGLLGVCSNATLKLRGGQILLTERQKQTRQMIDDVLKDNDISERYKATFNSIYDEVFLDDSEKRKQSALRQSLIVKCKHPIYSQMKAKASYLILSPFTFAELYRLSCYRLLGLSSAPLTIGVVIGFTMPCAVSFSMAKMYVPNKLKFPCKVAKWRGGFIFYGVSHSINFLTSDFEKKHFGTELPINAPELMGTLPTMNDSNQLKSLGKAFMDKT